MFYCLILNGNETHFVKETATRVSQIWFQWNVTLSLDK
jgi:hypothetical protein